MCLGIPGRIVDFSSDHPDMARVDVEGVVRNINIALLEDDPAEPGDWVLIHLGFALEKMTQEQVDDARSTLAVLGEGSLEGDPFAGFSFETDPFAPEGYGERPA
jgi:hydrogenase expression/formation protein HypC